LGPIGPFDASQGAREATAAVWPARLLWLLLALGVGLTATVVPGPFSIDESNYIVTVLGLRHGRLTVPGTEGLPPSRELAYFDPVIYSRPESPTPLPTVAPPLYAPIALPFAYFGWRGLVLLNTLSFLVIGLLVFRYAQDYATTAQAGWLAVWAFALGAYSLEYAQGVWPHLLSAALTTGAAYATSRVRSGRAAWTALAAGLLVGMATGVRYQNIVVAVALGVGLLVWSARRWAVTSAFAAGAALPLAVTAAINRVRLGVPNPISKGPGYLPPIVPAKPMGHFVADTAQMLWARVVDFAFSPPTAVMQPDPVTGVFMILGTMKKAWLQSAPWLGLALLTWVLVWLGTAGLTAGARREARALSLVAFGVVLALSAAGPTHIDGFNFNQRYFIELVPLAAVVFGWALDRSRLERLPLLGGVLLAGAVVWSSFTWATPLVRQFTQRFLPLLLTVLLLGAWTLARGRPLVPALSLLVGLSLGWALFVHVADDLRGSRDVRATSRALFEALAPVIPDRSALFTVTGLADVGGLLQLGRDVVVLDAAADDGRDAGPLAAALLARDRRVFVLANGLSEPALQALARTGRWRPIAVRPPLQAFEIEAAR
jgi:hypothetical protein